MDGFSRGHSLIAENEQTRVPNKQGERYELVVTFTY